MKATAIAPSNIALVKYWGKRDIALNLPATPSLSLTLDQFETQTTVIWGAQKDGFVLNGVLQENNPARRVFGHLDRIAEKRPPCHVESMNNFPTAAGLASSASAFAALTLAAMSASGQSWDKTKLSRIARQGSGSACRSFWEGFVVWDKGVLDSGLDSHGRPLVTADYWNLNMLVAVVDSGRKSIGSTPAMKLSAETSPYYHSWVNTAQMDLNEAIEAILNKNLEALGRVMEHSMNKMHGVMISSSPSIRYIKPASNAVLGRVETLRSKGIECYATMDAGPNVKILCKPENSQEIKAALIEYCETVYTLKPGQGARLV